MNAREPQSQTTEQLPFAVLSERKEEDPLMRHLGKLEEILDKMNYKLLLAAHLVSPADKFLKKTVYKLAATFSTILGLFIKYESTINNAQIIKLADLLLKFKQHVEKSGVLSAPIINEADAKHAAALNANFNWAIHFHFVIEKALEKTRNAYRPDCANHKMFFKIEDNLSDRMELNRLATGRTTVHNNKEFERITKIHNTLTHALLLLQHAAYHFLEKSAPTLVEKYAALRNGNTNHFFKRPRDSGTTGDVEDAPQRSLAKRKLTT